MESEMTVAENRADKQTDRGTREGDNLLMIRATGTDRGKMQMDPGICFHPGRMISHSQNTCATNTAHIRTKDTTTPEDKGLAQHRNCVEDKLLVHSRIIFCSRQGVMRTTVSTIEILAPLLNDELSFEGCGSGGSSPERRKEPNKENVVASNPRFLWGRFWNPSPAIN